MESNDILDIIKKRRSVKKYSSRVPDWDEITKVVEAGRHAPSCGNIQNWKFIVCFDPALRKQIADACWEQYWMIEAPIHIVICTEPQKAERYFGLRGERLYSVQNAASAAMSMMLEAQSLRLATCWVGAFEEELLKRAINCEEFVRPQIILTLGFAAEEAPKPPKYPLEAVMYVNGWRRGKSLHPVDILHNYAVVWEAAYHKVKDAIAKGGQAVKEAIDNLSEKKEPPKNSET